MSNDLIAIVLGTLLGCSFVGLLRLARTAGARHAPPAARTAAFQPIAEGTVWRSCHDTACGHMTTRHLPGPGGTYRCERAGQHRGDVHLTHTAEEGHSV